ncbi:cellulose biosynthesis protein BcsQ [Burkholderia ubonensis]|uniref:cellulose biosynthesis protein BcsQ n=1 Tax=Burkholderia ubonensis TaxID=101571 RepID=UPI0007577F7F|nr:cellulose biosynthesis protein BcsQ [Burkholderia ubonensis]KWN65870.1 chromosome partitioning protein ParA [Burkholderia ubonensis]
MKIVTVVSAKGGVGKTTLAANLTSAIATPGQRVVAVDLDPSNALRLHFSVPLDNCDGLSRAELAGAPWHTAMIDCPNDVCVLAFGTLSEEQQFHFEQHLNAHPTWLARGLADLPLGPSDIVILDTPPGSSAYTRAALNAAHFVLHVIFADAASYAVIPQMQHMILRYAFPRQDFLGVGYVVNQGDPSRQLNQDVLRVLRATLGTQLFPSVIHLDEGVREALACNTTLIQYDPTCQAAADLRACGKWLRQTLDEAAKVQRGVK